MKPLAWPRLLQVARKVLGILCARSLPLGKRDARSRPLVPLAFGRSKRGGPYRRSAWGGNSPGLAVGLGPPEPGLIVAAFVAESMKVCKSIGSCITTSTLGLRLLWPHHPEDISDDFAGLS